MLAESKMLGAGSACSGLGGVGQGIGTIFSSLVEAVATNPSISKGLSNYASIGFALTEAIALFIIMITLPILF
jgi:F-type H+-transporting ATPase subunit c